MKDDDKNTEIKFSNWKRKTTLFLLGQAVSLFGSSLVQFAIIWHITLTTRSGIMITVATICGFLPQILISLFAGVWADRFNRKFLIICSDSLIALSTLILAIFFLIGYDSLGLLFVISGVRSLSTGVQTPAINALVPQIVPEDKLIKINGINGSVQSLIMLLSPALSGALMTLSTLPVIFFIDVGTAFIGVSILLTISVPTHKKAEEKQNRSYIKDLSEGLNYVRKSAFIKSLLVFYSLFSFLIVPAAFLSPLMVARSFGEEVWRLTANEMTFFGGSIIGGFIIASWGGFKNKIYTVGFSCIGFGVMTVLLGVSKVFIIYLIMMFITGIFMPIFNSPAITLIQEKVEQDMQGRIFSLVQIVSTSVMPLGMLIFGPAADVFKIELMLDITGVLMCVTGVWVFYNRDFKG